MNTIRVKSEIWHRKANESKKKNTQHTRATTTTKTRQQSRNNRSRMSG